MTHLAALVLAVSFALPASQDGAAPQAPAAPAAPQAGAKPSAAELRASVEKMLVELQKQFPNAPTSQEEYDQLMKEVGVIVDAAFEKMNLDLANLSAEESEAIAPMIALSPKARAARLAILDERAKDATIVGFSAALEAAALLQDRERMVALLAHPAAAEGIASGEGSFILEVASEAPAESLVAHRAAIEAMAGRFNADAPMELVMAAEGYLKVAKKALPDEQYKATRAALIAAIEAKAAKAGGEERSALTRMMKAVNGAAARGELIGFPCPSMTWDWVVRSDGTTPWKSVSDLKGKVVVLDFWTTWCGPCVASFPKVAAMRKDYSESDLEIVGVTSAQGNVMHRKRAPVQCQGDVAKERAELLEYMKDMNVTWTVAMTAEDVFNPDFGIRGIPFVAILDREGKVFKAGLNPNDEGAIRAAVDECLAKK